VDNVQVAVFAPEVVEPTANNGFVVILQAHGNASRSLLQRSPVGSMAWAKAVACSDRAQTPVLIAVSNVEGSARLYLLSQVSNAGAQTPAASFRELAAGPRKQFCLRPSPIGGAP